ncbi:MAG: CCA tRNA nucleotidyltransferase [Bacteroidota bacterium]
MQEYLQHKIFSLVREAALETGVEVYVVGGFVRDCILRRENKDIDFVVIGSGIELARHVIKKLKKRTNLNYFKNFGTAMFNYEDMEIEFVGARKESYNRGSRKPVVENGTLEDDQKRRDFTINAMAISLNKDNYGELLDPFNGMKDIKDKIIRTPLDPLETFSDDPLRMLRAIRFATQLQFKIENNTFTAIKENIDRLDILSFERINNELNKILLSQKPSTGFILLEESNMLEHILPELHALRGVESVEGRLHKDNFFHTIEVLDNVSAKSDNLWLLWAALLHDVGKPATKKYMKEAGWTFHGHDFIGSKMIPSIFRRLRLPLNEKMKYVQKLVALHLRPIALTQEEVTDSAVRRLLFDAGDETEDLMTLCEADITSKNERTKNRYLANFRLLRKKMKEIEEKDAVRNFQPPVSGEEIMETFDIGPSKEVGIIKNAIKEAILDGKIHNNYKEARELMLQTGKELGLVKK